MSQNNKAFHPAPYIKKQVSPGLKANYLSKEVILTYLVARKYYDNQAELRKKTLWGSLPPCQKMQKYDLKLICFLHRKKMM